MDGARLMGALGGTGRAVARNSWAWRLVALMGARLMGARGGAGGCAQFMCARVMGAMHGWRQVPVEVDGTVHRVFVCKRPGLDVFMKRVAEQASSLLLQSRVLHPSRVRRGACRCCRLLLWAV